jgi:hypothetical protein
MPKLFLLMLFVLCCFLVGKTQAQQVSDVLPENTIAYLYGKDFQRLYKLSTKLSFGERVGEVEERIKGILSNLVENQGLDQFGFTQEFILKTITAIDSFHVAFLGFDPQMGMPEVFVALKLTDEAHYQQLMKDPNYLGNMLQASTYKGVSVYNFVQAPIPIQMAIYQSHLIATNNGLLLNQIIDQKFNISGNLTNNANYKKFSGLQRSGHFMTFFADFTQLLALLDTFGVTASPDFQMANRILDLAKLEAVGFHGAADEASSSSSFHLTMQEDHILYGALLTAPAPKFIPHILPSKVLLSTVSSLGDATEYFNRILDFADNMTRELGQANTVREEISASEAELGFSVHEMVAQVGKEAGFFVLPLDGIEISEADPGRIAEVLGLAVAVKNVSQAQAFLEKMFRAESMQEVLKSDQWQQESYNGSTIHFNYPEGAAPGMGLHYGFVTHPKGGSFVILGANRKVIAQVIDTVASKDSLASSQGYQNAFKFMKMENSREIYFDMSSLTYLLSNLPDMAPFMGMLENLEAQQVAAISVEKKGSFSFLAIQETRPQDVTDTVLQWLQVFEQMMGLGSREFSGSTGGSTSRPTKED